MSTNPPQINYVMQPAQERNPMGVAGFVLALIGLFLCWWPVVNWILWILGVVFSAIGVFRRPKGLAIAGLVISFIGVIIIVFIMTTIIGTIGMLSL